MQIQLNTSHVQNDDRLQEWLEEEVGRRLDRFGDHVTRVEAYIADVNANKGGMDKRCTLEVRHAGRNPIAVHHDAGNVADAVHGAVGKLVTALDSSLGRARDAHARETIRGQSGD